MLGVSLPYGQITGDNTSYESKWPETRTRNKNRSVVVVQVTEDKVFSGYGILFDMYGLMPYIIDMTCGSVPYSHRG